MNHNYEEEAELEDDFDVLDKESAFLNEEELEEDFPLEEDDLDDRYN